MPNAKLIVEIVGDARSAVKAAGEADHAFGKFGSAMAGMAAPATAALAGIGGLALGAGKAASDVEQAFGGLDKVFQGSAGKVKAWADQAAESVGLSKSQYAELATSMGGRFKSMGQTTDQAADSTKAMIELGADLAATYGGTTKDAVDALGSAMKGEADSAEKYNLTLSASAVNAKLAAKGQDKLTGAALAAAKQQAVVELAMEQSTDATGAFADEADSAAGSSAIASAGFANMASELGAVLLPIMVMVAGWLSTIATWVKENARLVQILVGVIAALAAGILIVNGVMKAYAAAQVVIQVATKAWAVAQVALNAVLAANPVGLVIIAVVALVAGIVLLWNKCEGFRNAVTAIWKAIANAAKVAWSGIKAAVTAVIGAIGASIRWAGSLINGIWRSIASVASSVWSAISRAISSVVGGATRLWQGFMGTLSALWGRIGGMASTAWNTVKAPVTHVIEWVRNIWATFMSALTALWARLSGMASTAWNAVKAPIQAVVDWAKSVWDAVVTAVSDAWARISSIISAAVAPIKALIDGIKQAWDSTVGAISSAVDKVSGWLSGILGKIGSVLSKGAEIVGLKSAPAPPPPSRVVYPSPTGLYSARDAAGGGVGPLRVGGGPAASAAGGVHITVNGALDADRVARQIQAILTARGRRVGPTQLGGVLA